MAATLARRFRYAPLEKGAICGFAEARGRTFRERRSARLSQTPFRALFRPGETLENLALRVESRCRRLDAIAGFCTLTLATTQNDSNAFRRETNP